MSDKQIDFGEINYGEQQRILWGRSTISAHFSGYQSKHNSISPTFVGHTPLKDVVRSGNFIFTDTGCWIKKEDGFGKLTMLDIKKYLGLY